MKQFDSDSSLFAGCKIAATLSDSLSDLNFSAARPRPRRLVHRLLPAALGAAMWGLCAPAGATDGLPSQSAGLVKRVEGQVHVHRGNAQTPLQAGHTLEATDRLVTGPDSTAAVVFRDGTQLTVGPSTDLHLRRYAFEPKADDYAFDVYLAKGRTIYASGKIGKLAPQAVRLDTPTATVGVRGTRLILEAE